MKIIGIDPAPSKDTVIYDGRKFRIIKVKNLKRFISCMEKLYEDIFICWDAPLSAATSKGCFNLYERNIEKFFNRQTKKNKSFTIPQGISTLGYAGCPHWTISQYIFGYPVLNYEFTKPLKYTLVSSQSDIANKGLYITETHPALSMWIWAKNSHIIKSWLYKHNSKKVDQRVEMIQNIIEDLETRLDIRIPKDEILLDTKHMSDKLDAYICWLLGKKLFEFNNKVKIYGDSLNGSFLLPFDDDIHNEMIQSFKK